MRRGVVAGSRALSGRSQLGVFAGNLSGNEGRYRDEGVVGEVFSIARTGARKAHWDAGESEIGSDCQQDRRCAQEGNEEEC